jgi:hypothetical protein
MDKNKDKQIAIAFGTWLGYKYYRITGYMWKEIKNEQSLIEYTIQELYEIFLSETQEAKQVEGEEEIFGYVMGGDFYNADSPSLSKEMKLMGTPVVRLKDISVKDNIDVSDEEIEKEIQARYTDHVTKFFDTNKSHLFRKGAKWMRDKLSGKKQ